MKLLTEKELCEFLKVNRVTLWNWRNDGMPFKRLGLKLVRYELSEVITWLSLKRQKQDAS